MQTVNFANVLAYAKKKKKFVVISLLETRKSPVHKNNDKTSFSSKQGSNSICSG